LLTDEKGSITLNLKFREAVEADIPAMSVIRLAVTENRLRDPSRITNQMYVDYLDRLGKSWVCEADGVIAGFAAADKIGGSIWALFISPDHEGLGIGKRLLALMANYLFAQGHDKIVLSTSADTRADTFYASQGWERGKMKDDVEVHYSLSKPRENAHVHPA
jgi:GNAT superfamily N-acetyltransferase